MTSAAGGRAEVISAVPDTPLGRRVAAYLLARDCAARPARTSDEVHRLAARRRPAGVVLPVGLGPESGWLTCAKLVCSRPGLAVVLVAPEVTPKLRAFARFAGAAALLPESAAPAALAEVFPLPRPGGG
ncbi:MAG TPA: hypothetical protein VIL46_09465 [Gemmataceae bacterium]